MPDPDYLGNYGANTALEAMLAGPLWMGLHNYPPAVDGDPSHEIVGGSYLRQRVNWSVPSARTSVLATTALFIDLTAHTVTCLGLWTEVSVGSLVAVKMLTTPVDVVEGGQFVVPSGDWAISFP